MAGFIVSKAPAVLAGKMSMGLFLSAVRIFAELSDDLTELYSKYMVVSKSMAILERLTLMFNLPSELVQRKALNRNRRTVTQQEREQMIKNDDTPRVDRLELSLQHVQVYHHDAVSLTTGRMKLPQGSTVAIVGRHRAGKSLLMRVMASAVFPQKGFVFIPSHLRVLFVPQRVMMPEISLWDNLTFGNVAESPKRVQDILRRLEMHKTLELLGSHLKGEGDSRAPRLHEHQENMSALTHTEIAKLQLARALIMNPEVLILQGPLSHFYDKTAVEVWKALQEHVRNRGFQLPSADARLRRPRTMLFSPTSVDQLRDVDYIWEVDGANGVRLKPKDEITDEDYDRWMLVNQHLPPGCRDTLRWSRQRLSESSSPPCSPRWRGKLSL